MAAVKPGDWTCASCGDHQFARNTACRKCGAAKPEEDDGMVATAGGCQGGSMMPSYAKPGDWTCTACGDLQFARNAACRKCGAAKSGGVTAAGGGGSNGAWKGGG